MNRKAAPLDLRQLHYFVVIAETGSISAAAAALGMAQASLSETIAKLEARFGTALMSRGPQGVTVTAAGALLRDRGLLLLDDAYSLAAAIEDIGSEVRGKLSIGLPPSLSLILSVPLAETVFSELPDVRLRVSEGISGHILDWVRSGDVDIGVVYEVPSDPALDATPLYREELFLAAAPDFLPAGVRQHAGPEIDFNDLAALPLVMQSDAHGSRRVLARAAKDAGIVLNVASELDSQPQIVEMVCRASGYAIVPEAAVIETVASGRIRLIAIRKPRCERTAYLVRRRDRPVSAPAIEVERLITSIVAEVSDRYALSLTLATATVPEA